MTPGNSGKTKKPHSGGLMTVLHAKAGTAETYIAGLGASGALIGGAIVVFVMLVGIVTFNSWPEASGLFTFSEGQAEVELRTPARTAAERAGTAPTALPTVIALGEPATRPRGANGGQPGADGGQTEVTPPESPGGGGGTPMTEAPTQSAGNLVSNLGNTLQQDTAAAGDTLNQATGTSLGNVVTGLGQTLNSTLHGLTAANE
jgi:hypothetical protein